MGSPAPRWGSGKEAVPPPRGWLLLSICGEPSDGRGQDHASDHPQPSLPLFRIHLCQLRFLLNNGPWQRQVSMWDEGPLPFDSLQRQQPCLLSVMNSSLGLRGQCRQRRLHPPCMPSACPTPFPFPCSSGREQPAPLTSPKLALCPALHLAGAWGCFCRAARRGRCSPGLTMDGKCHFHC